MSGADDPLCPSFPSAPAEDAEEQKEVPAASVPEPAGEVKANGRDANGIATK